MCKNNSESIDKLYKITGQMIRGLNQPSQYIEDWVLPKTTPITAKREIGKQCSSAREQLIDWVVQIRTVIELLDPHNN